MNRNRSRVSEEQREALSRAQKAASDRNVPLMLQNIYESLLLEGYFKHFKRRYDSVASDDIFDIIGEACYELCVKVSEGTNIKQIQSYLWKIIDRKLSNFNKIQNTMRGGDTTEHLGQNDIFDPEGIYEKNKALAKTKALSLAKSLIPRLGLSTIQQVMSYVIGAIENGSEALTSEEMGEALGLTSDTVRKSIERGFRRLRKIVKEEHLVDDDFEFPLSDGELFQDSSTDDGDNEDIQNDID